MGVHQEWIFHVTVQGDNKHKKKKIASSSKWLTFKQLHVIVNITVARRC